MTDDLRLRPDPAALAASLQLWVLELVVWLTEMLGEGPLSRALRRWAQHALTCAEKGATGLVVMAALKLLPEPVDLSTRKHTIPDNAPRGFACVAVRGNDMRRMVRHLFPRERDLLVRARRLGDFLDALAQHAQRLTRRIARIPPMQRMAMIAPVATVCVAQAVACVIVDDSS